MSFLFPLIASLLQASSFTLDKATLRLKRIDWRTYTRISFPLLFFFDALILLLVRPHVSWVGMGGTALALVLFSVLQTFITNVLYYRALDHDHLTEMQTWGLLHTFPVIIITGLVFSDERNLAILIPALVASTAVFWSHLDHQKLVIKSRTLPYILWLFISAPIGVIITKIILRSWNPIMLELFRDGTLALIFWFFVRKTANHIGGRARWYLIATNMLSATAWILYYYGYQQLGVLRTLLLFSIQPMLVYFFSLIFLREKFITRKFVAFLIVLACIAVAQLLH